MNKRTKLGLAALPVVLAVAYGAWCLRPAAVSPELLFPESVPPEARQVVESRFPRTELTLERGLDLLRKPFGTPPRPVRFTHWKNPENGIHSVHVPYLLFYQFTETDDGWKFMDEGALLSIHTDR